MVMSDNEVKMNVLQAKDPRAQIKICAELNATTQAHIKDILREQGVDLRTFNGKQPKGPIPEETPIQAIKNKIDSLLRQRAGIDSELADLKAMLTEIIDSIGGES